MRVYSNIFIRQRSPGRICAKLSKTLEVRRFKLYNTIPSSQASIDEFNSRCSITCRTKVGNLEVNGDLIKSQNCAIDPKFNLRFDFRVVCFTSRLRNIGLIDLKSEKQFVLSKMCTTLGEITNIPYEYFSGGSWPERGWTIFFFNFLFLLRKRRAPWAASAFIQHLKLEMFFRKHFCAEQPHLHIICIICICAHIHIYKLDYKKTLPGFENLHAGKYVCAYNKPTSNGNLCA